MGWLVTLLAREQHELAMGAGVSLGRFEEWVLPESEGRAWGSKSCCWMGKVGQITRGLIMTFR